MAYKKKTVAFLVVFALGSSVRAVPALAGMTLQKQGSAQSTASEPEKPSLYKSYSLSDNDANVPGKLDDTLKPRELFFKMMFAVLLVAALGAAAIYISKKLLPRITNLPGKKIRIIETVHLGPRRAVHLLKIGNQRLLVGSTNENITKLADVTDALIEMDLSATEINNN